MTKKSKYIYNEKKANRAVKFIETFVTFTKGERSEVATLASKVL